MIYNKISFRWVEWREGGLGVGVPVYICEMLVIYGKETVKWASTEKKDASGMEISFNGIVVAWMKKKLTEETKQKNTISYEFWFKINR